MPTWYEATDNPEEASWAESAKIRSEFQLIESSFALLPDLTDEGNKLLQVDPGGNEIVTTTKLDLGLITEVAVGEGLAGGGSAGDVTIEIDLSSFTAVTTIADDNQFLMQQGENHVLVNFDTIKDTLEVPTITGSNGIEATSSVLGDGSTQYTIALKLDTLAAETAIATSDLITFWDDSADAQKVIRFDNFKTALNIMESTTRITSLTAGDGLTGGGNAGTVSLAVDLSNFTAETTIADADTLAFSDASASNAQKKIAYSSLKTTLAIPSFTFGDGLSESTSTVSIDINELDAITSLADDDLMLVSDTSASNGIKKITWANVKAASGVAETGLSNVVAGDGLSGGGSGSATLALNIHGISATATTIANADFIAFSDESVAGDPTKKISFTNFKSALNIPSYSQGTGIDISSGGSISVDINELTTITTLARNDFVALVDESAAGNPSRKATLSNIYNVLGFGTYTGGTGVDVSSSNVITIDLTELSTVDSLAASDSVITTTGKITITNLNTVLNAL